MHRPWKRRFDVYVCTAAERGYALEAWRLLDSNNDIIPDNIRSVRVVCVPGGRKKELRHVFRTQAPITYRSGMGEQLLSAIATDVAISLNIPQA